MVKHHVDTPLPLISTLPSNCVGYASAKRYVDILLSFIALVALLPLLAVVAVGIRVSSSGPILYRAKRVGLNGKIFTMNKFRTMHYADQNSSASPITAMNDSRVFTLGVWLRRLKIDELPQLINVLRGEMSIVGPRPEDPLIVNKYYSQDHFEAFRVLPGLASPGSIFNYTHGEQFLGEHDAEKDYVEQLLPIKLAFDIIYVREASFGYDLKIICRTIWAMLFVAAGKCHFPDPPEMKKARKLVLKLKSSGSQGLAPEQAYPG